MEENKSIDENIDKFTKLLTDLENIEVKIDSIELLTKRV